MIKYHLLLKERATEWHTAHYTVNTVQSYFRK